MKNILGFFFGCIIAFSAQGQSALAKLKFEEAEAAFENANYTLSLSKVEDAEKVLGKVNPPLLHLKILSQHRILLSQPAKDLNLAADIITACTNYLSAYVILRA